MWFIHITCNTSLIFKKDCIFLQGSAKVILYYHDCHEFLVEELAVLHTASFPVSGGQVPYLSGVHEGIKAWK